MIRWLIKFSEQKDALLENDNPTPSLCCSLPLVPFLWFSSVIPRLIVCRWARIYIVPCTVRCWENAHCAPIRAQNSIYIDPSLNKASTASLSLLSISPSGPARRTSK